MRILFSVTLLSSLIVSSCSNGQAKQPIADSMANFEYSLKNAHPNAKALMTDEQLREMAKAASTGIAGRYLLGQDNAIIAIGFAQFVLEGTIENEMKLLTVTALRRQLLPMLINRYDPDYRDRRKEQLTKMLGVINSVK